MKNVKFKMTKVLNIIAWILISLLIPYIIIKSCSTYSLVNMRQTLGQLGEEITRELGINTIKINSPILQYIDRQNNENNNYMLNYISELFPINQYMISAKSKTLDQNKFKNNTHGNHVSVDEIARIYSNTYFANTYMESLVASNSERLDIVPRKNTFITGDISLINGESYHEDTCTSENLGEDESKETIAQGTGKTYTLNQLKNFDFLINNFYSVDKSTKVVESVFDIEKLLSKELTIEIDDSKPQILIYHTHSQEDFIDSTKGKQGDTIVGTGDYLAKVLTEKYHINVIHDTFKHDIIDGKLDRDKAYTVSGERMKKILDENPSIEVIIDLHRDGVRDDSKRLAVINGKDTAQLMFFNGLSRNQNGPVEYLYNPNLVDNLAFSLRLKLQADKIFPNLTKKIYLKGYRYNLELLPKSLLIELGNQNNTIQEAKNAMEPLAEILYQVLTKDTLQ